MELHFKFFMDWYGKKYQPFKLVKDSFLDEPWVEEIKQSTLVTLDILMKATGFYKKVWKLLLVTSCLFSILFISSKFFIFILKLKGVFLYHEYIF